MKISYNWIKELVDFDISPDDLAEELSLVGFEVDGVDKKGLDFPNVVVGKVLKKEKHPNADKLSLCTVTTGGSENLSIICGAPNVAEGQIVPVAMVGAELPGGFKIRKAKIRGVESFGMICSEQELGISEKSDGIWVLPDDLNIGEPLSKTFETDYVLDVGITPNRPDAMSHIGIAREVAAIAGTTLKKPQTNLSETSEKIADSVGVEIQCPQSCPRYSARLIRNVKIAPSPNWMVRRLEDLGMRSINNLIDITNYVLLETGQPLHAFDYDFVAGGKIIVRESIEGEKFVTLDEKEHELQTGTVLICDAEKPVALGGIMGGLNSEVRDDTKHILLESAYFQPESIQKSLRHLGMHTEASSRFERGTDPNGVLYASARAAQLFSELAGGEIAEGVVDQYPETIHPVKISLKPEKINRLLGTNLSADKMTELLAKVDLPVQDNTVIVPTFRPDMKRTADVAEEVGRVYGYNNIPMPQASPLPYENPHNEFDDYIESVRDVLVGIGVQEVVTGSLVNSKLCEEFTGQQLYPILNPLNADMDGMRNSLVPNLLNVLKWNINRQWKDLAIFELNRVYFHPGDINKRPNEEFHLAIALTGKRDGDSWLATREAYNFYDVKGLVEYFAGKISLDNLVFIPYDNFAVESQSMKILCGNMEIGYLGKINRNLQKYYDLETPVFVANINIKSVYELTQKAYQIHELPRFPYVERDLAFILNKSIAAQELVNTIQKFGGKYLQNAYVFDTYSGKQIEAGKKSIAFRLIFQSPEKTLVEDEINQSIDQILASIEKQYDAQLRS